jgi:autoinducer 2-degrading protein
MIVRIITCTVKTGSEAEFERETVKNRLGSIAEDGVLRFDVLKDADSPSTYYLYEVYRDQAAAESHKTTPHYKIWRAAVEDWMAEKRSSVASAPVSPSNEDEW